MTCPDCHTECIPFTKDSNTDHYVLLKCVSVGGESVQVCKRRSHHIVHFSFLLFVMHHNLLLLLRYLFSFLQIIISLISVSSLHIRQVTPSRSLRCKRCNYEPSALNACEACLETAGKPGGLQGLCKDCLDHIEAATTVGQECVWRTGHKHEFRRGVIARVGPPTQVQVSREGTQSSEIVVLEALIRAGNQQGQQCYKSREFRAIHRNCNIVCVQRKRRGGGDKRCGGGDMCPGCRQVEDKCTRKKRKRATTKKKATAWRSTARRNRPTRKLIDTDRDSKRTKRDGCGDSDDSGASVVSV